MFIFCFSYTDTIPGSTRVGILLYEKVVYQLFAVILAEENYPADIRIKSIFCFVIAPEMQRMGIATQLVERVCKDAAGEGFDYVEAYVNKEFVETKP